MSDTPRTDAVMYKQRDSFLNGVVFETVSADFARQLERELAAVTKELQGAKNRDEINFSQIRVMAEHLAAARAEVERLNAENTALCHSKDGHIAALARLETVANERDALRAQLAAAKEDADRLAGVVDELLAYKLCDHDMIVDEEFLAPMRSALATHRNRQP